MLTGVGGQDIEVWRAMACLLQENSKSNALGSKRRVWHSDIHIEGSVCLKQSACRIIQWYLNRLNPSLMPNWPGWFFASPSSVASFWVSPCPPNGVNWEQCLCLIELAVLNLLIKFKSLWTLYWVHLGLDDYLLYIVFASKKWEKIND